MNHPASEQAEKLPDWPPRMVVCVGAVVLNQERALFVRQAEGHPLAGQWSIPWGIVDPGETPESAILREIQEEGGILAEMEGLLGIQNLRRGGWLAAVFLCRHAGGEPTPDGRRETDRAAYLSLEEINTPDEPIETWCRWIADRVLRGEYCLVPPESNNPYQPRLGFL
jgi:ADP-ribose pyrophosphatase YjhB (NUDIX family)